MAAAVAWGGVAVLRRSRYGLLTSYNFLVYEHLGVRTGVLWKQPPSRTFFSDKKKFHTASVGQAFRLRPFHVLVATAGGYAGYRKYEGYKLEQLEERGIEVPVKLASEWKNISWLGSACMASRSDANQRHSASPQDGRIMQGNLGLRGFVPADNCFFDLPNVDSVGVQTGEEVQY
ncbi:hypothetical protein Q9966_005777 [Columba livia]|nr:hypothetical protein Q9966_005777 [Columba livia]